MGEEMTSGSDLALKYDQRADVLYVRVGEPVPADVDEDDAGLLVRFAKETGEACGVTVLGFASTWELEIDRLADLLEGHLHIPAGDVARALASVAR